MGHVRQHRLEFQHCLERRGPTHVMINGIVPAITDRKQLAIAIHLWLKNATLCEKPFPWTETSLWGPDYLKVNRSRSSIRWVKYWAGCFDAVLCQLINGAFNFSSGETRSLHRFEISILYSTQNGNSVISKCFRMTKEIWIHRWRFFQVRVANVGELRQWA
jgi:hypothetical protein